MTHMSYDVLKAAALACVAFALLDTAAAQNAQGPPPDHAPTNFLDRMFAPSERAPRDGAAVTPAQMSAPDLAVRLDRLENEIRQLTGMVEQLQYRNQQLEQQLRRLSEEADGAKGAPRVAQMPPPPAIAAPPPAPLAAPAPPTASG